MSCYTKRRLDGRALLMSPRCEATPLMGFVAGSLPVLRSDLNLKITLTGGQLFRWKKSGENQFTGVFADRVWKLTQLDDCILYNVTRRSTQNKGTQLNKIGQRKSLKTENNIDTTSGSRDCDKLLSDFFRLDVPLADYYEKWSVADPQFRSVAESFCGIRMVAQDPVENLFAFICSANNHIARIATMVEKMCSIYGDKIANVDGVSYYSFPSVDRLADLDVEAQLRSAGFGWRAKYIQQSAAMITEQGGKLWFDKLKALPYKEAKSELMKLSGIGAKVADCICLMGLAHLEAIPVDTHIFQVAKRYLPHLRERKTLTNAVYNEIGDHFRQLFGPYAGWAHTVLFATDLKQFQNKDSEKLRSPLKNKAVSKKVKLNGQETTI